MHDERKTVVRFFFINFSFHFFIVIIPVEFVVLPSYFYWVIIKLFLWFTTEQYAKPGLMEYNQMAVPNSKSSKIDKLPVLVDWDSSDR